ncbi:MAG: hypothetical protein HQL46_12810 [Gammaproteobacteria bacterium]|nr:hypothetical protein [Gammaproteobacteria bacterium]
MSDNSSQSKENHSKKKQPRYMLNYNVMAIFLFAGFIAFKIGSLHSVFIALLGLVLSSPSVNFPKETLRWSLVLFIVLLLVLFFPELSSLKSKI